MARIRSIKPDFFRHENLYEAERESGLPLRLAFAGLWTACDREGRFEWRPRQLKLDCLPYDEVDFSRVLDALATRGFIVRYRVTDESGAHDFGFIPSWSKHQVINPRERASVLPVPEECEILQDDSDAYSTRAPRVSETHVHARGEREGKGRGRGKGTVYISAVADATRRDDGKAFEEFWGSYPKREGANPKAPARKAFEAAIKAGADPPAIIAGARNCAADPATKIGTPYVPQAVKWLRDRRWQDYANAPQAPPVVVTGWRPGLRTSAEILADMKGVSNGDGTGGLQQKINGLHPKPDEDPGQGLEGRIPAGDQTRHGGMAPVGEILSASGLRADCDEADSMGDVERDDGSDPMA